MHSAGFDFGVIDALQLNSTAWNAAAEKVLLKIQTENRFPLEKTNFIDKFIYLIETFNDQLWTAISRITKQSVNHPDDTVRAMQQHPNPGKFFFDGASAGHASSHLPNAALVGLLFEFRTQYLNVSSTLGSDMTEFDPPCTFSIVTWDWKIFL